MIKKLNDFKWLCLMSAGLAMGVLVTVFWLKAPQTTLEAKVEKILNEESDLLITPRLRAQFVSYLVSTAKDHEFDPLLILAIMKAESSFRPNIISNRGAVGLLQIKLVAANEVSRIELTGSNSLKDPFINVHVGVSYLSYLRNTLGRDKGRMLSGYNVGPTKVKSAGIQSTPYSRKVLRIYAEFIKKFGAVS